MAGEYDSAIALALRLITKKGRTVTVKRPKTTGDSDASRPWAAPATSNANFQCKGVFLEPNNKEHKMYYAEKAIPGTEVHRYDFEVLIPASALAGTGTFFAPLRGDRISDSNHEYGIVSVSPLQPGDTPIVYILQVEL